VPSGAEALAAFWRTRFPILDGKEQPGSAWRGQPLVVNFWATWCPPCVEELPLLDEFYQQNKAKGWQMIAVAADSESKVRDFITKRSLQMPVSVLGADALSLSKSLGNLAGGLPFTLVLDSKGGIAQRKAGQIKAPDLVNWLAIR
jgi:thiol-disulfide isomerase/thioredoxin